MGYQTEWKVRAGDTDYSGLIYTPEVVDFIARTLQDFWAEIGFSNVRFRELEYIPPIVNVDVNYRGSIWVDDSVTVAIEPSLGSTSVTYEVVGTVEGEAVFDGSVTTAFIDKETHEPIPVPEEFRDAVERFRSQ